MKTYHSNYQTISFFADKKILRKEWYDSTNHMNEHDFKQEVLAITSEIEHHQPFGILDVTTNFVYGIEPDLQEWIDVAIFPRFHKAGVQRYALLVSKEFISQISIEQTMEEDSAKAFQVRYFANEMDAENWLLTD